MVGGALLGVFVAWGNYLLAASRTSPGILPAIQVAINLLDLIYVTLYGAFLGLMVGLLLVIPVGAILRVIPTAQAFSRKKKTRT